MESVSCIFIRCAFVCGVRDGRNFVSVNAVRNERVLLFVADCVGHFSAAIHCDIVFPSGGGAYVVARDHLSTTTSLVAGAALMIDYVLTVAVSISSGVAALTSAFPVLLPWKVEIAIALVLLLMILNLRGITESATVFAYPTYLFIISVLVLIAVGGWQLWHEGWNGFNYREHASAEHFFSSGYGVFILLRAFASGCSAMTGVEAISNGVPSFKPDSSKNAAITMGWMSFLLGTMFLGITILAAGFGVTPMEHKTVISQIGQSCVWK